jgi:hypothetical protein
MGRGARISVIKKNKMKVFRSRELCITGAIIKQVQFSHRGATILYDPADTPQNWYGRCA